MKGRLLLLFSVALFTGLFVVSALRLQEAEEHLFVPVFVHARLDTNERRLLHFDLLSSTATTHHFLEEAVADLLLEEDEGASLPLVLAGIDHLGKRRISGRSHHHYRIRAYPRIKLQEGSIAMAAARLRIVYATEADLVVPVGPFSYITRSVGERSLSLRSLRNIPGDRGHGVTSLGFVSTLENTAEGTVCIEGVRIHAGAIAADGGDALILDEGADVDGAIEAFLSDYDPAGPETPMEPVCIEGRGRKTLFVPFAYRQEDLRLFRYPVEIVHTKGTARQHLILEDFPFINADPFAGGLKRVGLD